MRGVPRGAGASRSSMRTSERGAPLQRVVQQCMSTARRVASAASVLSIATTASQCAAWRAPERAFRLLHRVRVRAPLAARRGLGRARHGRGLVVHGGIELRGTAADPGGARRLLGASPPSRADRLERRQRRHGDEGVASRHRNVHAVSTSSRSISSAESRKDAAAVTCAAGRGVVIELFFLLRDRSRKNELLLLFRRAVSGPSSESLRVRTKLVRFASTLPRRGSLGSEAARGRTSPVASAMAR